MNSTAEALSAEAVWRDAVTAAQLIAVDPAGLGGAIVRARPGPVRERWLEIMAGLMPHTSPVRKLPAHVSDDRLLGGLDLAATLRAGRPIAERGVLAEADGGVIIAQMTERMASGIAARLGGVLDTGEVKAERDGLSLAHPARIGVIALDEGIADDERAPPALADRLAFRFALDAVPWSAARAPDAVDIAAARDRLATVNISDEIVTALAAAAEALGAGAIRHLIFATRAARAAAALDGRADVDETDAALAGRLVLAPRATRLPADAEPPEEQASPPPPPPADQQSSEQEQRDPTDRELDDLILAAAAAALPPGLLARAAEDARRRCAAANAGKAGEMKQAMRRGRPAGVVRGDPRTGKRLSLVATLRSAAPWQRVRRAHRDDHRIVVTTDDFRVRRLKHPTETTAIFVVDASGSSALHRLAEAKGAVELLLAECYVRRDRVALVAFRGKSADLVLPPTRSLVRAKRSLAGLPGGGGTPLAAALDAALGVADAVRRKGQTPVVVLLTDGRANIARDGAAGRSNANADALVAARVLRAAGIRSLLVDTSPKPQDLARRIAAEMDATYLPLPHAGSAAVSAAVKATIDVTAAAGRP